MFFIALLSKHNLKIVFCYVLLFFVEKDFVNVRTYVNCKIMCAPGARP